MAVPRTPPSGFLGGGTVVPQRHVDVAPILDSILGGTSTLIHQAYLRRVGQRQYELEFEKLRQEHEMRMATLQMIGAYHQAMIGAAQQRIAAKPAAVVQQQRTAATTLAKEFPEHHLVERDEAGTVVPYDQNNPADYVGALRTARTTKAASDKELQSYKDRVALADKAQAARVDLAKLREGWKKEDAKSGAKGGGAASVAQNRLRANDFLARIGAQFQGNYEQMAAFIGSDPEASRDAQALGVTDYAIRGTASQITGKASATATRQNVDMARSGMFTDPSKGSLPTPEDINKARTGLTVAAPPAARPTPPALPSPLATPPATWPPKPETPSSTNAAPTVPRETPPAATPAASTPSPLVTPPAPSPATRPNLLMTPAAPWPPERPTPGVDLAPTPITPLAKPQVPFQAKGVPSPATTALPGGLKAAPAPWKPGQPTDETSLSNADLWEHKRAQGLTPDAATAYVKGTSRIKLPASVPPPKPEDEQEPF